MATLLYEQTPGLIPQPASLLAAGALLSSLPLSVIRANADFANLQPEVFYQELYDGDGVTLPQSFVDGYQYQAGECVFHWERRSTVSNPGGLPQAAGGILQISDWLDPLSRALITTDYMVQGGATSDTNDGIVGLWTFGCRGRGLLLLPSGLSSFGYQPDSNFATGQPLTPSILQPLSASAQAAAVRCEVFLDAGMGTTWTPGWTPAVSGYGKPTWAYANGCYYQAAEVLGPTGTTEPTWATALNGIVVDGGVIWVCVGRGFSNGQQFSVPVSPVDGHVYTSAELVCCLTSWITTGAPSLTGPSGAGRIQRLQKSAPGGAASTTVTYWDGNNQTVTNDGVVQVVGIFQRALSAYASTPPAYNIFSGTEFMSGHGLAVIESGQTLNDLQLLNENVNNAAVRPEVFWNTGKTNAQAPTLPTSPISSYAYSRAECMNVFDLADTGAMSGDYALRLWVMTVDPGSALITARIDYNQGSNQITTSNGSLNIAVVAARAANNMIGGMAVIGLAGSPEAAPPLVNGVPNGSFDIWVGLLKASGQIVGVPSLWSISNSTADGYTTQQAGIDSLYSLVLDVGNNHAPANQQWVSLLSYPMGIVSGAVYSWQLLAYANPAITTGFIVRLHLRDINFANDVTCDLVPDQSLGGSAATFGFKFLMPNPGDTTLKVLPQPQGGTLSLTAAAPAQLTFAYLEIWNFKPNVSSTVIADDSRLIDLQATAGSVFIGSWNATEYYGPGNEVTDGGNYWVCVTANTNSEPSATNANWQLVGPTAASVQSQNNVLIGAWSPTFYYDPGNEVTYGGNYYSCLVQNSNQEPDTSPSYWQLVGPVNAPPSNPTGPWNAATAYNVGDEVTYAANTSGSGSVTATPTAAATVHRPGLTQNVWNNPANAEGTAAWATATLYGSNGNVNQSDFLRLTNFSGLSAIPAGATIKGIKVVFTDQQTGGTSAVYLDTVTLLGLTGSPANRVAAYPANCWPSSATQQTCGSSSDLWNLATVLLSQLQASGFGVEIGCQCTQAPGNGATIQLNGVQVTVYYVTSGTGATNLYKCVVANTNEEPDTNPQYWQLVGPATVDAVANGQMFAKTAASVVTSAGVPYTFTGAWSSATAYLVGNEVSSGGNYYLCTANSTNNPPATSPGNWQLLGPVNMDSVADGTTYQRMPAANMDSNRRGLIDLSQAGHLNKNLAYLSDGGGRYASLNSGAYGISSVNGSNQVVSAAMGAASVNARIATTFSNVALAYDSLATLASLSLTVNLYDLIYVFFYISSITSNYGNNNFFAGFNSGPQYILQLIDYLWGATSGILCYQAPAAASAVVLSGYLLNGTSGNATGTVVAWNQGQK
jgi:hypothetical protein